MRVSHIHKRINQQRQYHEFIGSIKARALNMEQDDLSQEGLSTWLEEVRDQWQHFRNNHNAIDLAISKIDSHQEWEVKQRSYFKNAVYTATYSKYLDAVMTLSSLSNKVTERNITRTASLISSTNSISANFRCARLPRLEIPKYDGSLLKWLSFKGLFTSLVVSDPSLSPAIKLQYLKNSLIGSAGDILENTEIVDENFQPAWNAVVDRYENPRQLIYSSLSSLYSARKMTRESWIELEKLYNVTMQEIRTLRMLKEPVEHWDSMLIFLTLGKLDSESIRAWEHDIGSSKERPTWARFQLFVETRIQTLKAYERAQANKSSSSIRPLSARVHFAGQDDQITRENLKCVLCNGDHYITQCSRYNQKLLSQRREFVNKHRLCYNCLGTHPVAKCLSRKRCRKCAKQHHTTLHPSGSRNDQESSLRSPSAAAAIHEVPKQITHAHSNALRTVILPTAVVSVINHHGNCFNARVLLDQGSEISLVTENLVQMLGIPRQSCSLSLNTINNKTSKARGSAKITLKPHFESSFEVTVDAVILPKLTNLLPHHEINMDRMPHLKGLQLADPAYNKPGSIDVILVSDLYGEMLHGPLIKGPCHSPVAQLTSFGWIVSGPLLDSQLSQGINTHHYSVDEELHHCLERFWRQEEIPTTSKKSLSSEDQECEDHFKSTHQRDATGRYIVRLPFNNLKSQLGDSMAAASRMLHCLQRKFEGNADFHQAYKLFMDEYRQLGHMTEVTTREDDSLPTFYLPHHGVIRESSSTTKLRVVFNGSCKTSNGLPINQVLHTGPKLQIDLVDVLIWFRRFKYVFSADIEKMYRQIRVHTDDLKYQRILCKDGNRALKYNLSTVTYGLACAPFLALRTINQLIDDERDNFPLATDTLTNGRYVDDVFGGADTLAEAEKTAQQVNQLCMAGQFPLRKWVSNHPNLLHMIHSDHKLESSTLQLNNNIVHALGMSWNSMADCFCFNIPPKLRNSSKTTKRSILSQIAQLFDPLGFLAPVFIPLKIFMQELWTIKLGWDDELGESQQKTWHQLLQSLDGINNIDIPRWIGTTHTDKIEIHGFCDASQSAMAAVVYVRIQSNHHDTTISFLCAKSKVSPLKRMTIPRLELSSAVMLAKLVSYCLKVLKFESIPCYLWTDSSIVYTWLNEHPSKWKDFVHNRVCLIQDHLPKAIWKHVPGKMNPADCTTRGLSAHELRNYQVWWTGPSWLTQDEANWPAKPSSNVIDCESLECRPVHINSNQIVVNEFLDRFSSLTSLIRMTAICKRVFKRLRGDKNASFNNPITPDEIQNATTLWIKYVQSISFKEEIAHLTAKQPLPRSTPIIRLMPFLDSSGLLRLGGRLTNSALPQLTKHPYIIPKDSSITTLLIQDAHNRTLHGSTQGTLNYLRQKYWIIGGRAPVRSFILKCIRCTRYRRTAAQQLMGQLPTTRVTPSRAFLHTGVDYAGPFMLKQWKGRCKKTYKSWIAVFICYTTSAIHLEIVSDYSTDAFLAAYRRFTARRGICSTLNSDCGTNFKGADKELTKFFLSTSRELKHFASIIANDGTKWVFNPPAAPHFGGKWEAAVKSMKYHLRRVVGDTLLTFEEMATLLTQIEAVLNSRPLCSLSNDADDLEDLTPGHFLIGHALNLVPEPNLEHLKVGRLSRWQHLSQMLQSFWRKWTTEYLQRYQAVYKWTSGSTTINTGSLVLIKDERYPPSKWPLGRVTQVHPGKDGIIRVATIKTNLGVITRSITKLCPLPLETSEAALSLPVSAKAGGKC